MRVLYQLDLRGDADLALIRESLDGPESPEAVRQGFELAAIAWGEREVADAEFTEIAPQWPAHRQPPVDRAILRLARHEMVSGYAPAGVAINEAIELAKRYGTEQSPAFVNGVLDKLMRQILGRRDDAVAAEDAAADAAPEQPS